MFAQEERSSATDSVTDVTDIRMKEENLGFQQLRIS